MKNYRTIFAAALTAAVVLPSLASAETVVIKNGGHDHDRGYHRGFHARAEYRPHNWRSHHDRVVIINRGQRHMDVR